MSKTRRWRPNESFTRNCNREPGGDFAHAHDRLLHAAEQEAEAAEGGRAFAQGDDWRTDHRDRDRRARHRRLETYRPRRQRESRQPIDLPRANVAAAQAPAI